MVVLAFIGHRLYDRWLQLLMPDAGVTLGLASPQSDVSPARSAYAMAWRSRSIRPTDALRFGSAALAKEALASARPIGAFSVL